MCPASTQATMRQLNWILTDATIKIKRKTSPLALGLGLLDQNDNFPVYWCEFLKINLNSLKQNADIQCIETLSINLSNLNFSSFLASQFLIREVFLSDYQSSENVSLQIGGHGCYWWWKEAKVTQHSLELCARAAGPKLSWFDLEQIDNGVTMNTLKLSL